MAKIRRVIRRTNTVAPSGFDDQLWPVIVALVVLGGFLLGVIFAFVLDSIWFWPSLIGVLLAIVMAVVGVCFIDSRKIRRAMQLSIVIGLLFHLVILVIMYRTEIFAHFWPDVAAATDLVKERKTVKLPEYHKSQMIQERPKQDFEKPIETEMPELEPQEVERQETKPEESPVKPQPTPVPEPEQTVKPNVVKKTEVADPVPRAAESQSKLSRQTNVAQPKSSQSVATQQVAQQSAAQSTPTEAQTEAVKRQASEAQVQRRSVEQEPTTVTQQQTAAIAKRQTEQTPEAQSTATPTLQRQMAQPTVVPRTDAPSLETPTVARQTDPQQATPQNTTANKQTTASTQVTRAAAEPTLEIPTEVTTQPQRREQPAEVQPTVAQAPASVPNQQPRSTTRPNVAAVATTVPTPSAAPSQSPQQPTPFDARTSPVERTATQAQAQRQTLDSEPTPVTPQTTASVARAQASETPTVVQNVPSPTATRQTSSSARTPATAAQASAATAPSATAQSPQPSQLAASATSASKQQTDSAVAAPSAAQPAAEAPSPTPSQLTSPSATRQPRAEQAPTVAQAPTSTPSRRASTQALPGVTTTAANVTTSQAPSQSSEPQPRPSSSAVSRQPTNSPAATQSQTPLDVSAASPTTQVAQATTARATSSNTPTINPQAQPTPSPARTARTSPLPASPSAVESPAIAQADAGVSRPAAEPARMALTKSLAGVAGMGQSINMDRSTPAAESPSLVASGSAQRAAATQNTPVGPALAPSDPARVSRSQAGAAAPSATLVASQVDMPTAAGADQPAEVNASASAALTQASSNAAFGQVTASKGSVEVDVGPTRVVSEDSTGRASGGGQPMLNFETQSRQIARNAAGGAPQMAVAAAQSADVPTAPKADGGGKPQTPEAAPNPTALVRTDAGGGEPVSGGPSAAAETGPVAELSTAQQVAETAIVRSEAAEAAPGAATPGGGDPEEDEEEKARRLARSKATGDVQLALSGPTAAGAPSVPAAGGGSPAATPAGPVATSVARAEAGGGAPAAGEAAAADVGPAADVGGGELVAASQMGRAESAQASPGTPETGGGTASPARASSGQPLVATAQAQVATIAGAPQSSGTPQGAPLQSQGIEATRLAGGAVGASASGPTGAEKGDVVVDAPSGLEPGASIGNRKTSPSSAEGPAVASASNAGAPYKKSDTVNMAPGDFAEEVALNLPMVGPTAPASDADMVALAGGTDVGPMSRQSTGGLEVNVDAADGPGGLGSEYSPDVGIENRRAHKDSVAVQMVADARFPRQNAGGPLNFNTTAVVTADSFRGRTSRDAGTINGGGGAPGNPSPQTEESIELGLVFLARHQSPDGSWSLNNFGAGRPGYENERAALTSDTAATGLALLAFQGAGYNHLEHRYQDTVRAGVDWLVKNQKEDGDLYVTTDDLSSRSVWLYSHSIAALALCEAYGMTQDPELRDPAQKAVDFIVKSQHQQRGGWRYSPNYGSDTSVTGWMMMALKSGELANLDVPAETYAGIRRWLDSAQASASQPYLYRYNPEAPDTPTQRHGRQTSKSITAVGLLMRLYTGWRRGDVNMEKGANHLKQNLPTVGTTRDPQRDTYYWYYATQVMFHMGGDYWAAWNSRLHPLLVDTQIKRGPMAGSWDPRSPIPDRWAPHAGRLYVTTMNLLSLEVYYRHLPLYEDTAK